MPNEDTKQRMNHTSATGGCVVLYKVLPYTNTKMKTCQRNPPQGMTTPPPHGNQQCDPPNRVPNETAEPRSETRPDHTPLPQPWPPSLEMASDEPPSPMKKRKAPHTHLGQTVPHSLERCDGTTHPAQAGQYHTPTHVGQYHTPTHAVLIGRVLNMQMGNQKAHLGRPQIYV
ncbi:hypothetical protein BS47DRAFT_1368560 [Hydnum rufescens UP504]|uniref:Uncharacterized protein n=1 Tax=Hydnum rufescens UP504 TaxID=1448309 RepID=A0A9P6AGE7_9AGAM|nr:hypothetical protein BS47DRAFT_1368560 [Hydnum rufescens UP504]